MASKYAKVIEGLPNLPPEDPSYQEEINKIKAEIVAAEVHTPESLAKNYSLFRFGTSGGLQFLGQEFVDEMVKLLGKEGLEDLRKEAQKKVTAYEQLLDESYDSDDPGWGQYGAQPNTLKLQSGASVSIQKEPTGKVVNKDSFRLWCISNGLENSLQLWPTTMNSLVKERVLDGQPTPDGIEVYVKSKIVWRKG
jgi:hypothetical protein